MGGRQPMTTANWETIAQICQRTGLGLDAVLAGIALEHRAGKNVFKIEGKNTMWKK